MGKVKNLEAKKKAAHVFSCVLTPCALCASPDLPCTPFLAIVEVAKFRCICLNSYWYATVYVHVLNVLLRGPLLRTGLGEVVAAPRGLQSLTSATWSRTAPSATAPSSRSAQGMLPQILFRVRSVVFGDRDASGPAVSWDDRHEVDLRCSRLLDWHNKHLRQCKRIAMRMSGRCNDFGSTSRRSTPRRMQMRGPPSRSHLQRHPCLGQALDQNRCSETPQTYECDS